MDLADQLEDLVDHSEDLSEALVAVTVATAVAITAAMVDMAADMAVIGLEASVPVASVPVASVAASLVKIFVNNKKRLKIYYNDVRFGENRTQFDLGHGDVLTSSKLCVPVAAMSARRCFKNK